MGGLARPLTSPMLALWPTCTMPTPHHHPGGRSPPRHRAWPRARAGLPTDAVGAQPLVRRRHPQQRAAARVRDARGSAPGRAAVRAARSGGAQGGAGLYRGRGAPGRAGRHLLGRLPRVAGGRGSTQGRGPCGGRRARRWWPRWGRRLEPGLACHGSGRLAAVRRQAPSREFAAPPHEPCDATRQPGSLGGCVAWCTACLLCGVVYGACWPLFGRNRGVAVCVLRVVRCGCGNTRQTPGTSCRTAQHTFP